MKSSVLSIGLISIFWNLQTAATPQTPVATSVPSPVESYNYVVGTQTIGAAYRFTQESKLVETARAIAAMGSNTIKFSLQFSLDTKATTTPAPKTLAALAERDPSYKTVFNMPFFHYLMWVTPLSAPEGGGPFAPTRLQAERQEIYDLTRYLLRTYNNTGKSFYLGNWEGDWLLTHVNPDYVPTPEEVQNMIVWVNTRQKAVDDARRDTPHSNVNVYYYVEVNRVQDAREGKIRVTNKVLPKTNPDFVSYSSYDSQHGDIEKTYAENLDYIQSQLPPKPAIEQERGQGKDKIKRIFIGEYGIPAMGSTPQAQDTLVRHVMRAGLRWGCPFVLYWEMYNNEVTPDGHQRGFWLIDDKGVKQPAYLTHQQFYQEARKYVASFYARNKRVPNREEYGKAAPDWLAEGEVK